MGANIDCFGKLNPNFKFLDKIELNFENQVFDDYLEVNTHKPTRKSKGRWQFIKKDNKYYGDAYVHIDIQKETYEIETIFTHRYYLNRKEYLDGIIHLFLQIEMLIGNSQELILLDSYSNLRTGCFDNISFDHKIQKLNDEGYLACSNFEEYKKIKIYEEIGYKGYLKIKV